MLATGLLLTLPLVACAKQTAGVATKDALCDQFKPVRWSVKDTDQTIEQNKANNAAVQDVCGWKPS